MPYYNVKTEIKWIRKNKKSWVNTRFTYEPNINQSIRNIFTIGTKILFYSGIQLKYVNLVKKSFVYCLHCRFA